MQFTPWHQHSTGGTSSAPCRVQSSRKGLSQHAISGFIEARAHTWYFINILMSFFSRKQSIYPKVIFKFWDIWMYSFEYLEMGIMYLNVNMISIKGRFYINLYRLLVFFLAAYQVEQIVYSFYIAAKEHILSLFRHKTYWRSSKCHCASNTIVNHPEILYKTTAPPLRWTVCASFI